MSSAPRSLIAARERDGLLDADRRAPSRRSAGGGGALCRAVRSRPRLVAPPVRASARRQPRPRRGDGRSQALYERAGFELSTRELPDYLPVVLEYLSCRDLAETREMLARLRAYPDDDRPGADRPRQPLRGRPAGLAGHRRREPDRRRQACRAVKERDREPRPRLGRGACLRRRRLWPAGPLAAIS